MEHDVFAGLIARVRAGDEEAVTELIRQFEPEVRREIRVRLRLRDPRLRRVLDSGDIMQSVLSSFLLRTAAGEYDLDDPERLRGLLAEIARNKVGEQARRHSRQRRDIRREEGGAADEREFTGNDPSPSRIALSRELLQEFRKRLSAEETRLADLWAEGHAWPVIAERLGGTADARRKQFSRAVDRIASELGLGGAE